MTLEAIFEPEGLLAKGFPHYEHRPQQLQMAKVIEKALASKQHAVIEGATGVGKSFAYLIPLILSGKRVLISTSNKNLQEQLANKDIPILQKMLPKEFDFTVLKGRQNYLCRLFYETVTLEPDLFRKSQKTLRQLAKWLKETETGDLEHFPNPIDYLLKTKITCTSYECQGKHCKYQEACFAEQVRRKAKESTIILINHALLALDLALKRVTEGRVMFLPQVDAIIIDEAHKFEETASLAFSTEVNRFTFRHLVSLTPFNTYFTNRARFLEKVDKVLENYTVGGGEKERIFKTFPDLESLVDELSKNLTSFKSSFSPTDEASNVRKERIISEGQNLLGKLDDLLVPDEEYIRWSSERKSKKYTTITLHSAPISIADMLAETLFQTDTVVCTSATLAVGHNFEFFKNNMGMPEEALELVTSSPFNFERNVLIYISPGELNDYEEVQRLLEASKGRALVLFTSYKAMNEIYEMMKLSYPLMIQDNSSRAILLKKFKETRNAVLFATKSFWEGVDIPGEDLVLVIIHKLPFKVPTDPIFKAKVDLVEKTQGNSFMKYVIPDTSLSLKQGVGRLIRTKTDKGVIAILDSRVTYMGYGKMVLSSLPLAPRTQSLKDVEQFFAKLPA